MIHKILPTESVLSICAFCPPKVGFVTLKIYDANGKEIITLVNENLKAGTYEAEWNSTAYSSGIYFYRIQAGKFTQTRKMILLK